MTDIRFVSQSADCNDARNVGSNVASNVSGQVASNVVGQLDNNLMAENLKAENLSAKYFIGKNQRVASAFFSGANILSERASERGGVMVEYALIVTLMAIGCMASLGMMEDRIDSTFIRVADAMGGGTGI